MAPAVPCAVVLRRTDPDDVQQRQIYVTVDGGRTQVLRFGDSVTLPLQPGPHTMKANNTLFWKTVKFSVDEGQTARFVVINKAGKSALGFLSLLGVAPLALIITREDEPK